MSKIKFPHFVQSIFADFGEDARLVGGCVRDYVMGIKPKDYDFATVLAPDQMIERFENKYRIIPTGIDHGTLTFMVPDGDGQYEPVEITTLRVDSDTDGRHAKVDFITDWKADASRRDFTMNAMYMNHEGEVIDYFGGRDDIRNAKIRFVGDAQLRIIEDNLRCLRAIRFASRFGFQIDPEDMELFNLDKSISAERIWSEFKQIVSCWNKNYPQIQKMVDIIADRFGMGFKSPVPNCNQTDPFMFIASLFWFNADDDWSDLNLAFFMAMKPSKEEQHRFQCAQLFYEDGRQLLEDYLCGKHYTKEFGYHYLATVGMVSVEDYKPFTITGSQVMAITGLKPGPQIGEVVSKLKSMWVESNYFMTSEELLKKYANE